MREAANLQWQGAEKSQKSGEDCGAAAGRLAWRTMTKKYSVLLAVFWLALPAHAFDKNPSVAGHAFASVKDGEEASVDPSFAEQLKKDIEFVKETEGMSFKQAVATLKKIVERKTIYPEIRTEALKLLLLRFERASGRTARALEKYLGAKLRSRHESFEDKKKIYDSLAGEHTRAVPFMVSVAADRAVPDYVRFQACKDLAQVKLKPGQRKLVRNALSQIAQSKAVKNGDVTDLSEEDVRALQRKF
jgi:hypothetical protein